MALHRDFAFPRTNADAILICPRGGNTGDALIADACERFLRDRGIDVWRSNGSIEQAALAGDGQFLGDVFASFRGMVMFPGGGNIGIYPDNGEIRAAVIAQMRPRQRCLIFSQSAFQAERALANDQVTVWCRDAVSNEIMRQAQVRTCLVPDVAFYMDDLVKKCPGGNGTFFIKRTRGGDAETVEHGIDFDCPKSDLTLATPLPDIIDTLERYQLVVSDRLHGALIALMMRKKVVLLPVGYHKIRSFFETWLGSLPGVAFAATQAELFDQISGLTSPSCDLADLFCEYADPAFERFLLGG